MSNKKDRNKDTRKRLEEMERGFSLAGCCGDDDVDWKEVSRVDKLLKKFKFT